MAKGITVPRGCRSKDVRRKKNSGHGSDHNYGRQYFATTCVCGFTMKGGVKKPVNCGACKRVLPKNGYVRG